ncbi:LysR substrate-binding domain-containing protein [Pseudoteredinibacter isoporae]|uniref:DNA-binding transcriptional LysR family regulator n=1 Tax=Pseudoteredinibacter isoporae TaxID=570281 RepID=A0A7X0JSV5_9GAMM|nr:LysR substrate-binding domain-containing protein [Pseudoteredinibacter isoporae]MBB6521527.1 DNA-binding transcriptional LysR family regulator [Pseudoteredinibacter isoporae]
MKPILNLEVLEVLDAIERRGSFAKAAEELDRVTSAVSYTIQKLEEQLDIVIYRREGRRSVLTPAGRLLLEEGRHLLTAGNDLVNRAKEVATGWEPRLRIAVEALQVYPEFFRIVAEFLAEHPSMEIDIRESVLNGGWDALIQGQVDLLVAGPGPIPVNQGLRAEPLGTDSLLEVIAECHPCSHLAGDPEALKLQQSELRRVVLHDTSVVDVARSAGLGNEGRRFYVQTIEQKVEAILAGIGIGFVPLHRAAQHLESGRLLTLSNEPLQTQHYLAWKISNRGKGLQELCRRLLQNK